MKLNWTTLAALSLCLVAVLCIWRFFPQNPTALALASTLALGLTSSLPELFGGKSSDSGDKP